MAHLIAITGGIGSGKSVASCMLRILGYHVYDCDSEAKRIIKENLKLKESLKDNFGPDIYNKEGLDNRRLAKIVFNDKEKLIILNNLIHPIVKEDILEWSRNFTDEDILFFETAILKEAKLEDITDSVILVDAPVNVRINRVMKRNNIPREEVEQRIKNQNKQNRFEIPVYRLCNDENKPLIPQIENILYEIRHQIQNL